MEMGIVKAGMILKETLPFESESAVLEKGTILTSTHIKVLEKSGLSEIEVIPLPDISNEYERQIYQSYINLEFCFRPFNTNERMTQLKNEVKEFMYDYFETSGGNSSDG